MSRAITAALFAAAASIATSSAQATVEYKFFASSLACSNPQANCQLDYWDGVLRSLSISLSSTPAFIRTETSTDAPPYYTASGFHAANFAPLGAIADPWKKACIGETYLPCGVYGQFDLLSSLLVGSLSVHSYHSNVDMRSDGGSTWTGYFQSDKLSTSDERYPVFAGVWRAVPEPSPVALIGAGLAGLIWVRRRKDTREKL